MNTVLKHSMACGAAALLTLGVHTTALAACADNVLSLLTVPPYNALNNTLHPRIPTLKTLVHNMLTSVGAKQFNYNNMVTQIQTVLFPGIGASPRLLLTESDGT